MPRGPKAQLFEVVMPEETRENTQARLVRRVGTGEEDWQRREEEMRQAIIARRKKIEEEEKATIQAASEKTEINPWVDRTGWARYLQDQNRGRLLELVKPADAEKEPILHRICERFDGIIAVAQQTMLTRVNIFTRFEANRKEIGKEAIRPFNARMEDGTLDRYRQVWKG
jgi:hypothetical protein